MDKLLIIIFYIDSTPYFPIGIGKKCLTSTDYPTSRQVKTGDHYGYNRI